MQLVFRRFGDGAPLPHELWLRPADARDRDRRDVAALACEAGVAGFQRGAGDTTTIVVQQDPTLDDMLAAAIVERQLRGERIPDGTANVCRYATLCREGLRPGRVPIEESLEGIHAAFRSLAGADLTDPAVGAKFARDWQELAAAVFAGIENGIDPFTKSFIADDPRFARPRAFLLDDHKVYRQDVARGERWLVQIPDGPSKSAGLLLDRPKSLLWKHWARCDEQSPVGGAYLLTAVEWGHGQWVFSTDPVHRQSIKSLAEKLQAAESRLAGEPAGGDAWFDGKPFGHTLVAAPRAGTRLPRSDVLRIVKQWCRARRAPAPQRATSDVATWALAGIAVSALVALIVVVLRPPPAAEVALATAPRETVDDKTFDRTDDVRSRLFILGIGVSRYADPNLNLDYADDDARELVAAFRDRSRQFFDGEPQVRLVAESDSKSSFQPDAPPTREGILEGLLWLESGATGDGPSPNDLVIITISAHGMVDRDGDYYLLTRCHRGGDPRPHGLSWKHDIAKTLNRLKCTTIVILDTCHAGGAVQTGFQDAGHPGLRRFAAQPADAARATKLSIADATPRGADDPDALDAIKQSAMEDFRDNEKGVLVLPACLTGEKALEHPSWGHGVLTLAVLEALQERVRDTVDPESDAAARARLPFQGEFVLFADIEYYAHHRVKELTGGAQLVEVRNSNPMVLIRRIPLAAHATADSDPMPPTPAPAVRSTDPADEGGAADVAASGVPDCAQ